MLKIFKRNKEDGATVEKTKEEKLSVLQRMRHGLKRTRANLGDGIADLVLGKKIIDEDLLEEIETQLLVADVGAKATQKIINNLTEALNRQELDDSDLLLAKLKQELFNLIAHAEQPLHIPESDSPYVILMVGINGAGKTTTIGKLAKKLRMDGHSVMLAAGDTFRAAAIEQLQAWGEKNDVAVVAQHSGADSASVIYDAFQSARARKVDVLLADTAGRLHTQSDLMQELIKVVRVIRKLDQSAPHEVMLVLDAGIGQNSLNQVEKFNQAIGVSGITITKLDGTAKGGILFAISQSSQIPVRFIGVGEGVDDLRSFCAKEFVNALFD